MPTLLRRIHLPSAALFLLALLFYIAFGAYADGLALFAAPLFVASLGALAAAASVYCIATDRDRKGVAVLLAVASLFVAWAYAPTDAVGTSVRFELERPNYARAAEAVAGGKAPACVPTTCTVEFGEPSYVVFPWGGLLSAWNGVVYDPTDNMERFIQHKPAFTATVMGCKRLRRTFYMCGFA